MTAPLHTQLDRLEALFVPDKASSNNPAETILQDISQVLYGKPVPDMWTEHLLADKPVIQQLLIEANDIEMFPVIEQAPATRKAWKDLLKKDRYQRPQTAVIRDKMQADFLRYVAEDEQKKSACMKITIMVGIVDMVIFLVIFFNSSFLKFGILFLPLCLLVNAWINRASVRSFLSEKGKSTKEWNWTEFLNNQALDTDTLSLLKKYPDLRKIALSFRHSDVGFLVGDAVYMQELTKKRDALTALKQEQADAAFHKKQEQAHWAQLGEMKS